MIAHRNCGKRPDRSGTLNGMTFVFRAAMCAAALAAAAVPSAATAAATTPPGSSNSDYAEVTPVPKAYFYWDKDISAVRVVFRPSEPVQRRKDGHLRGGINIEGSPSSLRNVGKKKRCYSGNAIVRNGSFAVPGKRVDVKIGSQYKITFVYNGLTVERTLKLRAQKPGDWDGKSLGC